MLKTQILSLNGSPQTDFYHHHIETIGPLPLFSSSSSRDADGDVDTCPMWTFPTVRPTSMNKLQKGYTHTDSEVRHHQHSCTCSHFQLFPPLNIFFLFAVRRLSEKTTQVSIVVCFGHTHFQRGRQNHWNWDCTSKSVVVVH